MGTQTPTLVGFDKYLVRLRERNPSFRQWFDGLTAIRQAEELDRLQRQHAFCLSEIHRDAHAIYRLASQLADRMKAFAERYDGTEGEAILAAAGLPDDEIGPASYRYEAVRADIATFGPLVAHVAGLLEDVAERAPRRAAA